MAKSAKPSKSLADDWIKQVVTGQRHKLAHFAEGGVVETDEPTPVGFAKYLMRGAQMLPAPVSPVPEIRQRIFAAPGAVAAPAAPVETPAASEPAAAPVVAPAAPAITQYATGNTNKVDQALKDAGAYADGGDVDGGDVDGPGSDTSDSIPAMLSDGEYVLPADTVKAVGKTKLDALKALTHTPTGKPSMKGMVAMRADGGSTDIQAQTQADRSAILSGAGHLAAAAGDIASQPVSIIGSAYNNLIARPARAVGVPLPNTSWNWGNYGPTPVTDYMYGADGRGPAPAAPATPTATATTAVDNSPPTPTVPATPAAQAAQPVTAPAFAQRPDLISESERLVNTPGLGLVGLALAKRVASGAGSERSAEISGQYGLQREAMNANEQLEQQRQAERQRQQQQETWTPTRGLTGEPTGVIRIKGGQPEFKSIADISGKPTQAQFLAKARLDPRNAKTSDEDLTKYYNATYPQ